MTKEYFPDSDSPPDRKSLREFYEERLRTLKCPSCALDEFVLHALPPGGTTPAIRMLALKENTGHAKEYDMRCIALSCTACGHVNFYYLGPYYAWRQKQKNLTNPSEPADNGTVDE